MPAEKFNWNRSLPSKPLNVFSAPDWSALAWILNVEPPLLPLAPSLTVLLSVAVVLLTLYVLPPADEPVSWKFSNWPEVKLAS